MYYIYRITNLINGKTYIGQHKYKKTPYDDYMGSGTLLRRAYKKYDIENFVKEIIVANIKDKETIDILETKYIAYERTTNGNGVYNIADGGGGPSGYKHSEEAKTNIAAARKGKKWTDETKTKISASMKGIKRSEETKAKMSKSKTGHLVSSETKFKISDSLKGQKHSDEAKAKMSAAKKDFIKVNIGNLLMENEFGTNIMEVNANG